MVLRSSYSNGLPDDIGEAELQDLIKEYFPNPHPNFNEFKPGFINGHRKLTGIILSSSDEKSIYALCFNEIPPTDYERDIRCDERLASVKQALQEQGKRITYEFFDRIRDLAGLRAEVAA